MIKKQSITDKPKGKNRSIRIAFWIILIALVLTAVYFRVNPKWKAAELTIESAGRFYQVQSLVPDGKTLETRIIPPEGYERVHVNEGSFGEYLRNYSLLPDDIKIPAYDGTTISSTDVAAVFDISLGTDGYQQCADSIIRLYSDYFYEKGEFDKISFLFSNGDECSYNNWRKGMRMLVFADYSFEIPFGLPDNSEQQYRNYLKQVMRYAGTLSLQKESNVISVDELSIGDIICDDRHVVMIVDEAINEKGEKCYLIGQSFIPSVCFHILTHTEGTVTSPWYTQEQLEKDNFVIGSFPFAKSDIRRWKDGFQ